MPHPDLPDFPKVHNRDADVSREELERRLWRADFERNAAKHRLETLREAFQILRELAGEAT